jgi:hypothetical protein
MSKPKGPLPHVLTAFKITPISVPSAVLAVWQRVYYATAVNDTLFSQALYLVLRSLQDLGIAVIVLNGAALAEPVYPSGAVRPRHDVDLLVRAENLSGVGVPICWKRHPQYLAADAALSLGVF